VGVPQRRHLPASDVTFGERVAVGQFCRFITGTHEPGGPEHRAGATVIRPIVVGDGVWIGACSTILPGVTIGRGSVVAAGSVVGVGRLSGSVSVRGGGGGVPGRGGGADVVDEVRQVDGVVEVRGGRCGVQHVLAQRGVDPSDVYDRVG